MKYILSLLMVVAILVATACGGSSSPRIVTLESSGDYSVVKIPWKASSVRCIQWVHRYSNVDSYSGLSCDFTRLQRFAGGLPNK